VQPHASKKELHIEFAKLWTAPRSRPLDKDYVFDASVLSALSVLAEEERWCDETKNNMGTSEWNRDSCPRDALAMVDEIKIRKCGAFKDCGDFSIDEDALMRVPFGGISVFLEIPKGMPIQHVLLAHHRDKPPAHLQTGSAPLEPRFADAVKKMLNFGHTKSTLRVTRGLSEKDGVRERAMLRLV